MRTLKLHTDSNASPTRESLQRRVKFARFLQSVSNLQRFSLQASREIGPLEENEILHIAKGVAESYFHVPIVCLFEEPHGPEIADALGIPKDMGEQFVNVYLAENRSLSEREAYDSVGPAMLAMASRGVSAPVVVCVVDYLIQENLFDWADKVASICENEGDRTSCDSTQPA